ncbi:MAG: hypothetical protein V3R60_07620, partial [Acidobacteriota bacterium]
DVGDGSLKEPCPLDLVTVDPDDFLLDRIKSDGMGLYTDGLDVSANLGSAKGDWRMTMDSVDGRSLSLDFSGDCVSPGECDPPTDGLVDSAVMVTRGIDLRKMTVGVSKDDLQLLLPFRKDGNPWIIQFNPTNGECDDSSGVSLTRTAADTWVIEASHTASACLHLKVGGRTRIFKGRYRMPFKVTLVCKDASKCPPAP